MIDAVSAVPAGAPAAVAAAPAAPGDFFAQILAAVMTGLASGAGSAEAAPEEAAAGNLPLPETGKGTGDELAAEQAAAGLAAAALNVVPAPAGPAADGAALEADAAENKTDHISGPRTGKTRDAATAAFLLAASSFAAPFSAAVKGAQAGAAPEPPAGKTEGPGIPGGRAVPEPAAVPLKEAAPAPGVTAAAREAGPTGKEPAAEALPAERPELKYAAKPAAGAAPVQPPSKDAALKTDLAGAEAGQNGEKQAAGGQPDGDLKGEVGKNADSGAVKAAASEKAAPKDALRPGAAVTAFMKEQVTVSREPETASRPAAAGHTLSAASVERLTAAAGGLEASGNGKISMEINEPGLGKVRVEMGLSGGEVNISLQVEKGEAGQFLSGKVPELVDALAQRGISSGVEVFSGNDGGHGGSGREGRNAPRRFMHELETAPAQDAQAAEEGRLSVYA